jgi:UDP-N-acetylglucosamine--N-acetylmuramyl-(pentapeptide) pyrophosphoryl-undecaprenol N-acetylglucosamine transferase
LANRLAARFTHTVLVSFEETAGYFPHRRVMVTGNPVRSAVLADRPGSGASLGDRKRVLVLGGSQGARGLNRLVSSALTSIAKSGLEIEIVHQTGAADAAYVRDIYGAAGVAADVHGFIADMAGAYARADLVVGRGGAGTLAELTALGKPSVLIPYPAAAGGHQVANARKLAKAGAAVMLLEEETGSVRLAAEIQTLLESPETISRMGINAKKLGMPGAAEKIATVLTGLSGRQTSHLGGETSSWKGAELRNHV